MVRFLLGMVFFIIKTDQHFVHQPILGSLISMKCTHSTFPGVLLHWWQNIEIRIPQHECGVFISMCTLIKTILNENYTKHFKIVAKFDVKVNI